LEQEAAIGALLIDGIPVCSFVMTAGMTGISAKHCFAHGLVSAGLVSATGEFYDLAISSILEHETMDLASFSIQPIPAGIRPIAILLKEPEIKEGLLVEIAGRGITEFEAPGALNFLVEPIASHRPDTISVSNSGLSGACFGDSGGPMLARNRDGVLGVIGILAKGSEGCLGVDEYVRLSGAGSWLERLVEGASAQETDCGTLGPQGRCFEQTATWCDGNTLVREECDVHSDVCGWADGLGYRCIPPDRSPCGTVNEFGTCDANVAVRCAGGILQAEACPACSRCSPAPSTGHVECFNH
jgi:hypothetical protein